MPAQTWAGCRGATASRFRGCQCLQCGVPLVRTAQFSGSRYTYALSPNRAGEFCCDCIPCGVADSTFQEVEAEMKFELIDAKRQNSILHLFFDNCGLFPDMLSPLDDSRICDNITKWRKTKVKQSKNELFDELLEHM